MPESGPKQKFDIHRTLPGRTRPHHEPLTPIEESKSPRSKWKIRLLSFIIFIVAILIFVASWDAINISRASRQLFGSGNLLSLMSPTTLRGSSRGRVNTLVIGYSKDDPGHQGAKLTDSIMVLSLSTTNHTGYELSVPRDLFVNIPGFGYAKINEAYQDGGIKLIRKVIDQNFKIHIDHYVIVDYSAVRDLVNAVGGIDVKISSPDKRGLYDPNINKTDGGPLKLSNGWHQLNGQEALNLTRARGDDPRSYGFPASDFDRTFHQRQVLTALQQKLSWKLILNPKQNGQLFQAIAKNLKTDIKQREARPFFSLFRNVKQADMKSVSFNKFEGQDLLTSYGVNGISALIPAAGLNNYSQIQSAVAKLNK